MTRHYISTDQLEARGAELSEMYREKFQAAMQQGKPLPPDVTKQFLAKHRELAIAYGTLPRSNGAPRPNKMPPDAIIITSQLADDAKAGRFGPPPYFRPRDVPLMTLALIKKLVYARDHGQTPESRKAAEQTLRSLLENGVIPPQGVDALQLFDNDSNLVRKNGENPMNDFSDHDAGQRRSRRTTRNNTHVSRMQDKLGYVAAATRLVEFCRELDEIVIQPLSRQRPAPGMPEAYALDHLYNRVELLLKAVGLHDYVEHERQRVESGRSSTLEYETYFLKTGEFSER